MSAGIHSRRRAMDKLGIEDPDAEFQRWLEEEERIPLTEKENLGENRKRSLLLCPAIVIFKIAENSRENRVFYIFLEMSEQVVAPEHRWLPLGEASKLVGVNQVTLRLWADKGLVRVFRTAGGHRRFVKEDLLHLIRKQSNPAQPRDLGDRAVQGFRRHLRDHKVNQFSLNSMDEDSRDHLRVLGRRLAEVAIRYHKERRRRPALLEEARFIGSDYAVENQKLGYTLTEAVGFFLSHRNRFVGIVQALLPADVSRDETPGLLRDMAALSDTVLLALISQYQKPSGVHLPGRTTPS